MKIYTNDGNPFGLNLLMLAKFAKKQVAVEKISLNDATAKELLVLPTLEMSNGLRLFSVNAVARFLFPDEGETRDEWLEWSTTLLAPALAHHMATGHRADPNAFTVLNSLAKELEDRLKVSTFVAGEKLTAADIGIWSLLAPEGTLKGAQNVDHLKAWYRKINDLPETQLVISEQPLSNITFTSLQNANRFNGLHHIALSVPSSSDSAKLLAETAISIADTVTDDELNVAKKAFVFTPKVLGKEPRTVLPKAGERNVLITSALPYVNNVPHLGNIIGSVLSADIFARYSRSFGYNTFFVCGTDEYGTATENKALAENLSPKEICDKYFEVHNGVYRWFGIGFDYFGRTTHPEQTEVVQAAFKKVYDAGYIIKESVEQLLCQKCDRFLADRFVEGTCPHPGCGYEDARGDQCDKCGKLVNATELIRPRCQVCETSPVVRLSDQLFMDLPKIEPKLREWVERTESGWTNNARVITRSWLREGLKPRCITRDLKWGIPVPLEGYENKVFYVWFDALFGYVSMTKRYTKDYMQWWQPASDTKVELFQFMAKDNVPFHSVVWPSVLLSSFEGHTVVSNIMAVEYLNYEDGKFSKSRGIGVFGNDAQETGIPPDVWRFYLACARPEGQDSSFSWNDLAARNNSDLLNNLGNFINRALVFCEKNFNSIVPDMVLTNDELVLLALINRELRGYINSLEKAKLRDGIRHMLSISRHGNGYMQAQQPWVLLKGNANEKKRAATVIGICSNIACLLGHLLFPYMPSTARILFEQLNTQQRFLNTDKPLLPILLPSGHKLGKPAPLFAKLEQCFIDGLKQKYGGSQSSKEIVTSDFQTEASNDKKPKTLYKLADLEKAVQAQGDKVRQLKSSSKDKSVWLPEVNRLLDLKKQLAEAHAETGGASSKPVIVNGTSAPPAVTDADKVKELENKITKQGEKVRKLKSSDDETVWKPEVDVLLALKKELSVLTGALANPQGKNKKKK